MILYNDFNTYEINTLEINPSNLNVPLNCIDTENISHDEYHPKPICGLEAPFPFNVMTPAFDIDNNEIIVGQDFFGNNVFAQNIYGINFAGFINEADENGQISFNYVMQNSTLIEEGQPFLMQINIMNVPNNNEVNFFSLLNEFNSLNNGDKDAFNLFKLSEFFQKKGYSVLHAK